MEIKEIASQHFPNKPIYLLPGDSIVATATDGDGNTKSVVHVFSEARKVDTVKLFEADRFLGLKNAIGGVFGEAE